MAPCVPNHSLSPPHHVCPTRRLGSSCLDYCHQQLSEADNIKVAVRVRPLFPHETDKGGTTVVQVGGNTAIKVVVPGPAGTSMQRDFAFHACLGPEVGQADVMHLCGVPQLLEAALAGYNVTVFAYGQTGSGKTYTMSGREEVIGSDSYAGDTHHDGIMTRAVQHLFAAIEARKNDTKYGVAASYLEIYNEGIYDLLNLKASWMDGMLAKNLPVKWDATLGFFVPGLKQVTCTRVDTMMEVIRTGMKHRHVGSHELNIESSRSHSIMTIVLHATPTDPSAADFGTPRIGKISFVDLAGSERLKDTKSEGAMLKETTNINKSLFVLGKVISALAERDSAGTSAHIPYRDSKLTKLLMDSLGGNALALMIACCSPASTAVEETLSTLSYATRAKNIQNRPTVQYDPKEAQIANLRREIELLRQENVYLREQVRMGGTGMLPDCGTPLQSSLRPAWGPPGTADGGGAAWPPQLPDGAAAPPQQHPAVAALTGTPPRPPSARMMSPRVASSADGLRGALTSSSGTHLEPLRVSSDVTVGGAARRFSQASGGPPIDDDLMMRRLMETQSLLARFSEENGRLAKENDRLRAGRQLLSQEHGEVLDEIESLRGKLTSLESAVLSGVQTPTAAKAALHSAVGGGTPHADGAGAAGGGYGGAHPGSSHGSVPGTAGGSAWAANGQPHGHSQGVANVLAVGGALGNSGSMRTRTKYGSSGGGAGGGAVGGSGRGAGGGGDDSIIVADRSKLALLLGDGPVEPAVPVRPVPIKPPEPAYANPSKVTGKWFFTAYVFMLAPNQTPYRDQIFIERIVGLGQKDGFVVNPVFVSLFNIMGIYPAIYAALLVPAGRSENKVPAWPFVAMSFALGAFALLPYMALWRPYSRPEDNPLPPPASELEGWNRLFLKGAEGPIMPVLLLAGSAYYLFQAVTSDSAVWLDYMKLFDESRLVHVTSIDFATLTALAPFWMDNDATGRNWDKRSQLLPILSFLPVIGPCIYLLMRPKAEQPQ
ncbi:hypothetical protein GPECTOR_28g750 [Gonium pectorale]|uniref:Kinesin-like protein n=1 Tax=Gonium pectorale TaxID=33097 RepID=A0A150GEY9_GONPE|nr:hypothetical protein GPECTOR_28g750 [Gonium pectorale]|eukprot:KXZ48343.1 hypothetical protein GPECTOR_28g750 [Gonium pectorale]